MRLVGATPLHRPARPDRVRADHRRRGGHRAGPAGVPTRCAVTPTRSGAWERLSRSRTPLAVQLNEPGNPGRGGQRVPRRAAVPARGGPDAAGRSLSREQWDAMWADLVALMRDGVRKGRIDTVRREHDPRVTGRAPRVDRPARRRGVRLPPPRAAVSGVRYAGADHRAGRPQPVSGARPANHRPPDSPPAAAHRRLLPTGRSRRPLLTAGRCSLAGGRSPVVAATPQSPTAAGNRRYRSHHRPVAAAGVGPRSRRDSRPRRRSRRRKSPAPMACASWNPPAYADPCIPLTARRTAGTNRRPHARRTSAVFHHGSRIPSRRAPGGRTPCRPGSSASCGPTGPARRCSGAPRRRRPSPRCLAGAPLAGQRGSSGPRVQAIAVRAART